MKTRLPFLLFVAVGAALLWHLSSHFALRGWKVIDGNATARVAVEQMMRELEGRNLATLRLHRLREQMLRLPGVADAELRLRPPDALEVRLIARRPLASWRDGGLVDIFGVRYEGVSDKWLPTFSGPAERAAGMANFYLEARTMLSGAAIAHLHLGENGEWRVFLRDGVMLNLGRDHIRERVRRYARHADDLRRRFARMRAVDLRYEKGFSISLNDEGRT